MKRKLFAIVIGIALVFSAGAALAGITSDTADYSVTLVAGCMIDTTATGTDFGTYLIGSPNLVGTPAGSVTITCNTGINYTWGVNGGINFDAGAQKLRLNDGFAHYIDYRLFQNGTQFGDVGMTAIDSSYTQSWTALNALTATGNGAAQTYPLTADVDIAVGTVPGTYNDTVTVTVVWP
ncbi:MAG: spore coat U domain-containing protein [Desulfococcaceae bacterium]